MLHPIGTRGRCCWPNIAIRGEHPALEGARHLPTFAKCQAVTGAPLTCALMQEPGHGHQHRPPSNHTCSAYGSTHPCSCLGCCSLATSKSLSSAMTSCAGPSHWPYWLPLVTPGAGSPRSALLPPQQHPCAAVWALQLQQHPHSRPYASTAPNLLPPVSSSCSRRMPARSHAHC
jgi:hypothetical protein